MESYGSAELGKKTQRRDSNLLAFRRFMQGFDSVILCRKHLSRVMTPITTIRINPVAQIIFEVCRTGLPRRIVTGPDRKLSNDRYGFFFPVFSSYFRCERKLNPSLNNLKDTRLNPTSSSRENPFLSWIVTCKGSQHGMSHPISIIKENCRTQQLKNIRVYFQEDNIAFRFWNCERFLGHSSDNLDIQNAALRIVALPITVRAAWRAY